MPRNVLVIPDKFKGTLTAQAAAEAIAAGWKKAHPGDNLELLPMSDGGDGFGEIISALIGAKSQKTRSMDAAHRPIEATWWWNAPSRTAVIESAKVIGLAMLPPGKYHPFQLDTFGLGQVLRAAADRGARTCVVGIGGSATNDGGFGMARGLGWKFFDANSKEFVRWTELPALQTIQPPKTTRLFEKLIVAVDVKNPLHGRSGCTRVYGPQKGLRPEDFAEAEVCLKRLSTVARQQLESDHAKTPGAGAAGGLGFGLLTFLGAEPQSGFDIFAAYAGLEERLARADLVLTGEGALDDQTLMGKGVGRVALLCREMKLPCIGLAGTVSHPEKARKLFTETASLIDVTTLSEAKRYPAKHLRKLSETIARTR